MSSNAHVVRREFLRTALGMLAAAPFAARVFAQDAAGTSTPSVHNHAYPLLPFGITGRALRPMVHTASVIGAEVPDLGHRRPLRRHGHAGAFDGAGVAILAATLGGNACALMRGHGAVVAAGSLKQAVMIAIYLKLNAEVQLRAMAIGTPRGLSDRARSSSPGRRSSRRSPSTAPGSISACAPASSRFSCSPPWYRRESGHCSFRSSRNPQRPQGPD